MYRHLARPTRSVAALAAFSALLLGAAVPATAAPPSEKAPPRAPHERAGHDSLLAPGEGIALQVCQVCHLHGLAGVLPNGKRGSLVAVTVNIEVPHTEACGGGTAVVSIHERTPVVEGDPYSGGPGERLATAWLPFSALPTGPAHVRFDLDTAVPVRPGQELVLVVQHVDPVCGYTAHAVEAPGSTLYGYRAGVWNPGSELEIQARTHVVNGPSSRR